MTFLLGVLTTLLTQKFLAAESHGTANHIASSSKPSFKPYSVNRVEIVSKGSQFDLLGHYSDTYSSRKYQFPWSVKEVKRKKHNDTGNVFCKEENDHVIVTGNEVRYKML